MRKVVAMRGHEKSCRTWGAEAALRMLHNNLDVDVAERPEDLIVYGGIGKAARNWECFDAIVNCLRNLDVDETLLIQSGKPVGIIHTHSDAPRVLLANSNLVPRWATWEHFNDLDRLGLMMYGQMTAGSWIYIGTQGILQGTYETFAACGRKHFNPSSLPLSGRIVLSAGLGGMGGAQPLAVKLAGGVFIGIEVDREKVERRIATGYLDEHATSIAEATQLARRHAATRSARSIGVVGNVVDILDECLQLGFFPDVITDQTSAHDPLNGYVPQGVSVSEAIDLRKSNPAECDTRARSSIARHVRLLLEYKKRGCIVFDYGNNLRGVALDSGVSDAFKIPGFVPEYIRPLFCEGSGPFRWVALSGDPEDIAVTDKAVLELFPENENLRNWIQNGARHVRFQGLPARICWLKYGERATAGLLFNELVKNGQVKAPLVIGRDHLDCGSVASPNRETEGMLDGSDAISDWVFLNAMTNAVNGASWVSLHHGGGVGMGFSQHAGVVVVADGTEAAAARLKRVLSSDPALGILRHADAGYASAIKSASSNGLRIPMPRRARDI